MRRHNPCRQRCGGCAHRCPEWPRNSASKERGRCGGSARRGRGSVPRRTPGQILMLLRTRRHSRSSCTMRSGHRGCWSGYAGGSPWRWNGSMPDPDLTSVTTSNSMLGTGSSTRRRTPTDLDHVVAAGLQGRAAGTTSVRDGRVDAHLRRRSVRPNRMRNGGTEIAERSIDAAHAG